jgi:hypothetical protein
MVKEFKSLVEVDEYVNGLVINVHPNDLNCIFLGGSFVIGTQTPLSDIDYTACVKNKFNHSRFIFQIIKLKNTLRLLSIYFYNIDEILPRVSDVNDEHYLWIKGMMSNTRFAAGNKKRYESIVNFYKKLTYSRQPKAKTLHKSFGKLLELIARIKKWNQQNKFPEMVYFGQKLAEHTRRLIIEINGPITIRSENYYLEAHFDLPSLPKNYKDLYLIINRYNQKACTLDQYENACTEMVLSTIKFLQAHKKKLDPWTLGLLADTDLTKYVQL